LQQYRGQLNLPAVGPGTTLRPGQDWQAVFDDLQSFENEISQHSTAAQQFSDIVKGFMGERLQSVHGVWQEEKMLVDQYVKDGLKKGKARGSESLRETLDGAPGAPPGGSEGLLEKVWELFKSCLSIWDWALGNIPSATLSFALELLGWSFRILFVPFNAFFRLCERLLANVFELFISMYEWLLTTDVARYALSSLKTEAITAGDQAFSNGISGLGDFFNLPYKRDLDHLTMMLEAKDKFYADTEAFDISLDEALKNGLATGYEDYYPSQLTQARGLLYALCHRVLHEDKRMLTNPPCEEDCRPTGRVAGTAAETIGRSIDDYLAAGDHQSLSKKGMFQPLWSLAADLLGGGSWNSRKLELICDSIGWLIAWGLRIAAWVLALCIFFAVEIPAAVAGLVATVAGGVASALGVEVVTVGALLTGASAVSAISGIVRTAIAALGFYPYSIAYPRDVLLVHGVYFAMVFRSPAERFQAAAPSDILSRVR
jgi:hypothetical protein